MDTNKPYDMERTVMYLRVSTEGQNADRQEFALYEYAKRNDLQVFTKPFTEKISGKILPGERDELQKLMEFVDDPMHKIQHILFHELSRLGRTLLDILAFIKKYTEKGINIHIYSEGIKTLNPDGTRNATTAILISVLGIAAELERDKILERTKDGKLRSVMKGLWSGGTINIPLGYKVDENYILVIDPTKSPIIEKMYNMYADGYSTIKICNYMMQKGIKTSLGHSQWKEATVRNQLTNKTYIGKRKYKEHTIDCPRIINDELYQRVQVRFKEQPEQRKKRKFYYLIDNKKIRCGVCGANASYAMTKSISAIKCSTYQYDNRCGAPGMNMKRFYNAVYHIISNYTQSIQSQDLEAEKKNLKIEINKVKISIQQIKDELKKVDGKRERAENLYVISENYSEDKLLKVLAACNKEEKELNDNLPLLIKQHKELKEIDLERKYNFNLENATLINNTIRNTIKKVIIHKISKTNFPFTKRKSDNYFLIQMDTIISRQPMMFMISSFSNKVLKLIKTTVKDRIFQLYNYDETTYEFNIHPDRASNMIEEVEDYSQYWDHTKPHQLD